MQLLHDAFGLAHINLTRSRSCFERAKGERRAIHLASQARKGAVATHGHGEQRAIMMELRHFVGCLQQAQGVFGLTPASGP